MRHRHFASRFTSSSRAMGIGAMEELSKDLFRKTLHSSLALHDALDDARQDVNHRMVASGQAAVSFDEGCSPSPRGPPPQEPVDGGAEFPEGQRPPWTAR